MSQNEPDRIRLERNKKGKEVKGRRFHWLARKINVRGYTIGAEVGVHEGRMARRVLRLCPQLQTYYLIDQWKQIIPDPSGRIIGCEASDADEVRRIFNRQIAEYRSRVVILEGDSTQMARRIEDGSLDFVFIDADHRYEAVWWDIVTWVPKLKPRGLLSGHDMYAPRVPGVERAVRELVKNVKVPGIDRVWYARKEDYVGPSTNTV